MNISELGQLLQQQFPDADIPAIEPSLGVGSFPEWDSLGHFNFLLLVESEAGIRFDMDEMSEMKTLAEIIDVIARKS